MFDPPGTGRGRGQSLPALVCVAATLDARLADLARRLAVGVDGDVVDELREVFLQVAIYAGVPSANSAFALAKGVLADATAPSAGDVDT